MTTNLKCYRVWFSFGNDEEPDSRCNLIDADSPEQARELVAKSLADDPEGFVIGKVECLD